MSRLESAATSQEAALGELRRAIFDGDLRPGTVIRPDDVAGELQISRIPVREALKILEGEGLVTHTPHVGYAVAALTADEIREIYDVRALLETAAIRRAVPRIGAEDRSRASDRYTEADAALARGDRVAFDRLSRDFHFALVQPCGMPRLLRVMEAVWNSTEFYRPVQFVGPEEHRRFQEDHAEILAAFLAGDAERLLAIADAHREHLLAVILAGVSSPGSPALG